MVSHRTPKGRGLMRGLALYILGHPVIVGDVIMIPNDTISAQKRTNASWAAIRGTHNIKENNQSTKGNTSGLIHRRSYANVSAAPV